jgi:HEAT repeat protein
MVRRAETFTKARSGDSEAIEPLLEMAFDDAEGPLPRANAVGYLGTFATPQVVPAMIRALKADHPLIRGIAALKMGEVEASSDLSDAKVALVNSLDDSKRIVRMAAAFSLLNLGVNRLKGEWGRKFESRQKRLRASG